MAGFLFRLETRDGATAEPSTFEAAVPNWAPGDSTPIPRADRETLERLASLSGADIGKCHDLMRVRDLGLRVARDSLASRQAGLNISSRRTSPR